MMNVNAAIHAANSLIDIVPLLGGSNSRKDYDEALALVEHLIEHDPDNALIDMLTVKIDAYENSAPEFAAFNETLANTRGGIAVLKTLMDQQGLNTTDFENEIGKRSLVSRVLSGERSLTLDAMRRLGARFNLPAHIFMD